VSIYPTMGIHCNIWMRRGTVGRHNMLQSNIILHINFQLEGELEKTFSNLAKIELEAHTCKSLKMNKDNEQCILLKQVILATLTCSNIIMNIELNDISSIGQINMLKLTYTRTLVYLG
jgi:hypothetical protein